MATELSVMVLATELNEISIPDNRVLGINYNTNTKAWEVHLRLDMFKETFNENSIKRELRQGAFNLRLISQVGDVIFFALDNNPELADILSKIGNITV